MLQPSSAGSDNGSVVGAEHFGKCRNYERERTKLTQDVTIATTLVSLVSIIKTFEHFLCYTNNRLEHIFNFIFHEMIHLVIKRHRQQSASHFLYIETISHFENDLQLKTAGKPWKESASRPPNLKIPSGRKRCDLQRNSYSNS